MSAIKNFKILEKPTMENAKEIAAAEIKEGLKKDSLMQLSIKAICMAQSIELDANYAIKFMQLLKQADEKEAKKYGDKPTGIVINAKGGYISEYGFEFYGNYFRIDINGDLTNYHYSSFPAVAFDTYCECTMRSETERIEFAELLESF